MYVKYYEGDIEDLCLTMCYTDNNFGSETTINFVPNGSEVTVTNENKMHYVTQYAHFILNKKDGE